MRIIRDIHFYMVLGTLTSEAKETCPIFTVLRMFQVPEWSSLVANLLFLVTMRLALPIRYP